MSQYTSPTPVSGFLDPNDPTLFPRLTPAQTEQLADRAETVSFSPGEILFEHRERSERQPLLLETTRPNVFAIGDVRSGSTKRVASAVGDGALVVRSMHEALNRRRGALA